MLTPSLAALISLVEYPRLSRRRMIVAWAAFTMLGVMV